MRFVIGICLAMLTWTLAGVRADAFDGCFLPICQAFETRVVVCYRPEWRAEKVPCVVQKVSYRAETTNVRVTVMAPKMFEERVRTCYYVPTPKVVERPVATCIPVPMVWTDPCTGCCWVSYCPQWVTTSVKCTVYDYRMQTRDETVRVCRLVPEERIVPQTRWIPQVTQEQSWTVRQYCVMVPYQTTVCVPVCCWR